MIDETFHLTPLDVRRYEFGKAMRGFDPERVNQFREQVAEELERLARVNQDLDAKARGFHEQLRAFRERDKAINEALVSAQQLRNEIREQAEKEGQLVIREARADAERLLDEARAEVRRIEDQVASLDRGHRAYVAQLRMLVERQLSDLAAAEQATVSIGARQPATRDAAVREGGVRHGVAAVGPAASVASAASGPVAPAGPVASPRPAVAPAAAKAESHAPDMPPTPALVNRSHVKE